MLFLVLIFFPAFGAATKTCRLDRKTKCEINLNLPKAQSYKTFRLGAYLGA